MRSAAGNMNKSSLVSDARMLAYEAAGSGIRGLPHARRASSATRSTRGVAKRAGNTRPVLMLSLACRNA